MASTRQYDVSVILPFSDDEELIGTAVSRIASHLREHRLTFELLAIDEDSGDNCHAILALLRAQVPELRVTNSGGPRRGFEFGAHRAQGRVLWLIEPREALAPLAAFGRAYRRTVRGDSDLVIVKQRFCLARRTRLLSVIDGLRGNASLFQRRLARRAQQRRLAVEVQVLGGSVPRRAPRQRRWTRLLVALTPVRGVALAFGARERT